MRQIWRPKSGDVVVRRPRRTELSPVVITFVPPRIRRGNLSSPWTPVVGFALLIAIGTFLLWLPWSSVAAGATDPRDAFFTAASAVTVTGLLVVDTATHWTTLGHVVILALIFLGGLGIMTGATLFYSLFLRHHPVTLADNIQVSRSLGRFQPGDVVRLTRNIAFVAFTVQLVGFLFLWVRAATRTEAPVEGAAWQALFHSVSAFNNAGFSISSADAPFLGLGDKVVLGLVALLVILGGIGYFVMADLVRHRHRMARWSLNTKMILVISGVLWMAGTLVFLLGEAWNPGTLGALPWGDKITAAVFHSINARTAGFQLVDFRLVGEQSLLWFILLMFIGGASASTAGGIKVTTVGVLVAVVMATLTSREQVISFRREVPARTVHLALTVALLSLVFVSAAALLQALWGRIEGQEAVIQLPFLHLLFDTVSAYGTTGLSTGIPAELSRWGQLFLVVTMFVGRLGPLTLVLLLVQKEARQLYHYPQEEVTIG